MYLYWLIGCEWFPGKRMNAHVCLYPLPFLPCRCCVLVWTKVLCAWPKSILWRKKKKRKKLQRSTGRQQAFFSLTSFYFILCWPYTPMITTQVDAALNARNFLGNGPADMQMSAGFWLTWFDRPLPITHNMPLNCSSFVQMDQRLSSSIWCSAVSRPLATTRWYVQDINLAHYSNDGRLQVCFMQPGMLGDIVKVIPLPPYPKPNRNTVTL